MPARGNWRGKQQRGRLTRQSEAGLRINQSQDLEGALQAAQDSARACALCAPCMAGDFFLRYPTCPFGKALFESEFRLRRPTNRLWEITRKWSSSRFSISQPKFRKSRDSQSGAIPVGARRQAHLACGYQKAKRSCPDGSRSQKRSRACRPK